MKGDQTIICDEVKTIAHQIINQILPRIITSNRRFTISIAGESGSGKTVLARAVNLELVGHNIASVVLCQDDYFVLPPQSNDQRRRENPAWLGPQAEVRLDVMDQNLLDAITGKSEIEKPLVDYYANSIESETVSLEAIKVVIAEGTYVSLLRNVDVRVFIEKSWQETLKNRLSRSRGKEVGDPFIENILSKEHVIIAPHRDLADLLVTRDDSVVEFGRKNTHETKE